ncbi:putative leucine-rich repeat domain superfamily, F-box-like domain superfamily [Helianthus anomalus]
MAEEEQNQPPKRIGCEDDDEDRISQLPDCLLAEILSRLPSTKDAIRTGALSKRWKHLWTCVPILVFQHPCDSCLYGRPLDFFSYVDKTLTQRPHLKVNKFTLSCFYDDRVKSQVHNWIRYAVDCNVEDLYLWLYRMGRLRRFQLDQFFFINSCFTHLTLKHCAFNPTGAISWKNLRKLCIAYGKLDEDLIENILSGSPVLETLVLDYCNGYRQLNITSKSVKNLVLHHWQYDIIEINAPNILTLKVQYASDILLLNVSSLVEAHLFRFGTTTDEAQEEMLTGFILNLLHVKDLKIGTSCVKVLDRLKAKGFICPSNLKVLDS